MSQEGTSAADLVNSLSAEKLANIFFEFGEEKFSYRIANKIVARRKDAPILTTLQLSNIITECIPARLRRDGHPARKCFQALRIAVNEELDILTDSIKSAFNLLNPGGVIAVITFHSLEDRIVKRAFKTLCGGCTCPVDFPVCVCGNRRKGRLTTNKPITASDEELNENSRSRSAKLRGMIKTGE